MRVADIRQRVLDKVQEVAASGDEEATAKIMDYSRAILIALAPFPDDGEMNLEELTLGTATAARILSLHNEYVREMIRRGYLAAAKENGEFRIRFPDLLEFAARRLRDRRGPPPSFEYGQQLRRLFGAGRTLFQQPPQEPQGGEQPA